MKICPVCKTTYSDDSLSFCLNDGAALDSAASSSTEVTQQMTFSSNPTVPYTPSFNLKTQSETPTQPSIAINTSSSERKSNNPFLVLTIVALLLVIVIGGATFVYFEFIKKDNSIATVSNSDSKNTQAPNQNNNSSENQNLKEELEKLKKQVNDQKNSKAATPIPTTSPTPLQTPTSARANSPSDGFLALRSAPDSKNGTLLEKIPHGETVQVESCQGYTISGTKRGRWCRVSYAGQQGWAFDAYLIY